MLFFRFHRRGIPEFSAENAWSTPWGDDGAVPVRGYSACADSDRLLSYFRARNEPTDADGDVVIFDGYATGTGPDLETLAVPKNVIARVCWSRFCEIAAAESVEEQDAMIAAEAR